MMNYYALIPLAAFLVNSFTWVYVFAQRRRTLVNANVAYLHLVAAFALWSLLNAIAWSPVPDSWRYVTLRLSPIAWASLGFYSLGFIYTVLERPRDPAFWVAHGLHLFAIAVSLFTDWIYTGYHVTYWGIRENFGPLFYPILLSNVVFPVVYGLVLLARRYRAASGIDRRVSGLLLQGTSSTLVLAVSLDVVLPRIVGIPSLPDLGSSVTVIMVVFVYRAVLQHNFLNVSLEETAIDVFERAPDGILIEDQRRSTLVANRAARAILGIAHLPDSIQAIAPLQGIGWNPEEPVTKQVAFERDGQPVTLFVSSGPIIKGDAVQGRLVVLRDITDEKRAEEEKGRLEDQLRQSQKMEAIGTLAGGIAHDMNNVLAGIMGFASAIWEELGPDHPLSGDVQDILASARRGRDLTRDLLGFARKGKQFAKQVAINQVVGDLIPMLERIIPKKIRIAFRPDASIRPVACDPNQMSHAVLNLALNAVDAMVQAGGDLVIQTDAVTLDDGSSEAPSGLPSGEYVRIRVRDTGIGMTEAVQQRAFEPFFTTKPPGQGTGLGLSMVYGTVRNHGGAVEIQSAPGQGTTVTLLLPAQMTAQAPERDTGDTSEPMLQGRGGAVLLVDDELLVREAGKRVLERLGFRVLLAHGGEHALDLFAREKAAIRLVILDMVMPGMDGAECFGKLRAIDPAARILLSSGFARNVETEALLRAGAVGFLPKPFDLAQLSQAVRASLL